MKLDRKEECYFNDIYLNNASYNRYSGIQLLADCEDFKIYNNTCDYNEVGIGIDDTAQAGSKNIDIEFNNLTDNSEHGIDLYSPYRLYLNTNKMYGSGIYIYEGLSTNQGPIHTVSIPKNNTVNDKPIYFIFDTDGLFSTDFPNPGQIILINCSNALIENFDFANCSVGIHLHWCDNAIIRNITAYDTYMGIEMVYCNEYNVSNIEMIRNLGLDFY